ncbi:MULTISPECIES: hypothetical protein [Mycobacteriaceae]|uniref:Uncharacterized protein n=1 Tax=Mycolicibacterium neoaurum VKM Ac-1815D TaxID=700508 RepID=V5XJM0_MYCNE|nr:MULTISPECIES: hypothetical protein [Mycobacteriaceae]AHC27849.1 hypothetical protein D174_06125 [Mycolicibacterium neoaurum VKM Ac-1815D]AMO04810.1 hypothetical protein MyAD_06005 [Mycolicibacterium neoaurum]AXK76888.1 hypothetical protein DXK33_19110 [Mycolicibacterium neoaurum]KJQ51916.1 hypothetical protein TS71_04260 [Mycolicibacterium neoaurum]KUM10307.1 hypothetical protein AVZ31_01120 [Mycolicibacterium neoaurum]
MTHISEPRAIGDHADTGPLSAHTSPRTATARALDTDAAGVDRSRSDSSAAESRWDSEGGHLAR